MIEKRVFVSEDGLNFDSERECIRHEEKQRAEREFSRNIISSLSPIFNAWSDDFVYRGAFVAKFNNPSDVDSCKLYIETHHPECTVDNSSIIITDFPCVRVVEWDGSWVTTENLEDVLRKASNLSAELVSAVML